MDLGRSPLEVREPMCSLFLWCWLCAAVETAGRRGKKRIDVDHYRDTLSTKRDRAKTTRAPPRSSWMCRPNAVNSPNYFACGWVNALEFTAIIFRCSSRVAA